jgi:pSer/pThr/pTyr-binding forkhead associated (FHA) protein
MREGLCTEEGIMNCPTCGHSAAAGTRFCGNCGAELAIEEDHPSVPDTHTIMDTKPVPYLLITAGPARGQTFELRGEVHLGRSRTNAIVLSDGKVSRNHARLDPVRSTYILTDLGSANGTFVNGVRITQPVRLRDGDSLHIGDTQFIFHTLPASDSPQIDRVADHSPSAPVSSANPQPVSGRSLFPEGSLGNLPTWVWVGCAVLVIVILLMVVALTTGILIGQGLVGG